MTLLLRAARRRSQLVGPAVLVAGAKVAGGVSVVALNLWVARELSAESYGIFAIAIAILLLMDGVAGAAFDAAVIGAFEHAPEARPTRTERAGLVLKLAAGAIATAFGTTTAAIVMGLETASVAACVFLGVTGLFVHRSTLVTLQLRQRFGQYAAIELAHVAARWIAVGLSLAAGFESPLVVIGAYALASWVMAPCALPILFAPPSSRSEGNTTVAALWRRARIALATTSVGATVARLDVLLIGAIAGTREAGIFGAASTLALAPMWLGAYLAPAFTAHILPYCRSGRMGDWLRDVQAALIVLAVIGVVVGSVLGPTLLDAVLSTDYEGADRVFRVLLFAGAAGFVTFPVVLHTLLFLSPRTYLVMDLVSLPLLLAAYFVAGGRAGALGIAWVTAIAAVTKACIAQVVAVVAVGREQTRLSGVGELSSAGVGR